MTMNFPINIESLDIKGLFTDIPLNQVIDVSVNELITATATMKNLDRSYLGELLTSETFELRFISEEHVYREINRVATGSSLSPLLANELLYHF